MADEDGAAFELIRYDRRGGLVVVTIDRPDVMNALNHQAHVELGRAFDLFEADPALRVAIITGSGERAFSTGNDLRGAASGERGDPGAWSGGFGGLTHRFGMTKPVIAAVNGWAVGGGFEIVLACDLVIAASHARFGLPEVRRGRMASAGGVHRLPRKLPVTLAMGMLLTGRDIDAETAHQWGLVNEVVAPEDLMDAAGRWADEIIACAPLAVGVTKQSTMGGLDLPLNEALNFRAPSHAGWWASEERSEGARAFVEKRPPRWSDLEHAAARPSGKA